MEALQEAVGSLLARWRLGDPEPYSLTIEAVARGGEVQAGLTLRSRSGDVLFETRPSHHRA
jgi:hypothetical protein